MRVRPISSGSAGPVVLAGLLAVWFPAAAGAQIGRLVSPGPLSQPHAQLEGGANCQKCHEPGRQVTASRCLACHRPVAERIRARKGVHRDVTDDCVGCHVEHAGRDGQLRPFDTGSFDHAAETGFPLDGRHKPLSGQCQRCHKARSYLTLSQACATCHDDPHKGRLGANCSQCHPTSAAFSEARLRFDHARTRFPLEGAHRSLECGRCHKDQAFTPLKFDSCASCHATPHRSVLGPTCEGCHDEASWKTQKIDHSRTAFPLRGRHQSLACTACHAKPAVTSRLKAQRCADCHADPHRGVFRQDCSSCHTETGFAGSRSFDHEATRFPLTGRHKEIDCRGCHKMAAPRRSVGGTAVAVDFRGLETACRSCHADVHRNELGSTCEACHTTASFRVASFAHPGPPGFFAGQHAKAPCAGCHVAEPALLPRPAGAPVAAWRFKSTPRACISCHVDPHLGQLGLECDRCHDLETPKFASPRFPHEAAFPLEGRHATLPCAGCHKKETAAFPGGTAPAIRFKGVPRECAGCHQDPHLGQLGNKCETCHTNASFALGSYRHASSSALFAGRHAELPCASCHKRQAARFPAGAGTAVVYKGVGTECGSCHSDAHQGSLGTSCSQCHEATSWSVISRGFHQATQFPLEGRHLSVPCANCHIEGVVQGTPRRCYDCHWVRRQDDRYRTRLGSDCESCHRPTSWTAVTWDHAASTGVPLSVSHRALGCDACHRGQTFHASGFDCYGCHEQDYARAVEPNHQAAGFPTSCEVCHRPDHPRWSSAAFSHDERFLLVGAHRAQPCTSCHRNGVYRGTPRDCIGCHRLDYERTGSPNHQSAGFPTTCEACHRATDPDWHGTFNHASAFPLVGVHASQTCTSCHGNNVYKGTPRDCVGCHRDDYDRTQNPNHQSAGFPTTCEACHRATDPDWHGTFNHASVFPLVGVHASQACAACHKNGVYKGTSRDCVGCHRADYDRTQRPNHAAAGFPTSCDSCHRASDASWGTGFDHNRIYPLLGRHLAAPCAKCHVNDVYRGTPRECYPCHQQQYDQARDPNHRAAGFPTTCESCHKASDSNWGQAIFNHTWFPITSGPHAGRACVSCHPDPSSYRVFTCLTCHTRGDTDDDHRGVAGYRYDSPACYACHPLGRH